MRSLVAHLIARKAEENKVFILILIVELLQALVLRCKSTWKRMRLQIMHAGFDLPCGSSIHYQNEFSFELREVVNFLFSRQLSFEVVE
jgi:hypothetical protein